MSPQYQLIMRQGPTPGATFALEEDQITVGRDSTNGIFINDAEISRRHATLTFQGGKYVLEDLGSTNGTFVNGQRLAGPRVLKAGEVVSFGEQIVFVFDMITIDPGATVASPRSGMPVKPVTAPPPQYVSPVPAPPPAPVQPVAAPPSRANPLLIAIVIGVLIVICACIIFLFWVDADKTGARWCLFFPFISACP